MLKPLAPASHLLLVFSFHFSFVVPLSNLYLNHALPIHLPDRIRNMTEEQSATQGAADGTTQAPAVPIPAHQVPSEPLPEHDELEIDDGDSTYGEGMGSDTTSLTSSIARGYIEHGRRYQTTKSDTIGIPSDDKQFDSMKQVERKISGGRKDGQELKLTSTSMSHLAFLILESQQENPLFRSPIRKDAQHILDLGTGDGQWYIGFVLSFKLPLIISGRLMLQTAFQTVCILSPSSGDKR